MLWRAPEAGYVENMGTYKSVLLALCTETEVLIRTDPALQAHHHTLFIEHILLNFSSFLWLRYLIQVPLTIFSPER